jgi:hypothetical protein
LAEQGKEDTFLDLVNFLNERYQIAQRIEREFGKTGKRSVNYTDTYQVEASEMTALSKKVTLIVQNLKHKESQVANTAHPPRRSEKIKVLLQEVERHRPETTRN